MTLYNDEFIVRLADEGDKQYIWKLWKDCFHDEDAFMHYYFDTYGRENEVLLLEHDTQIRSMLHLNPYSLRVGDHTIISWYIVGVATDEAFRHQGAMTALLSKTFEIAWENKKPFVYLMPASEAIYTPFQFAYIYDQQVQVKKNAGVTDGQTKALNGIRPAQQYSDYQKAALLAEETLAKRYDLYTCRDAYYMERLAKENRTDGGEMMVVENQGSLEGYVSYACENHFEIREICATDEGQQTIRTWIQQQFHGQTGECLAIDGRMWLDECDCILEKRSIIMGRITHIESFVKLLPPTKFHFSFVMDIRDQWISGQQGKWQWTNDEKGLYLEKTTARPDCSISIDALVQLLSGYKTAEQLLQENKLHDLTDCMSVLKKIPVIHRLCINEIV